MTLKRALISIYNFLTFRLVRDRVHAGLIKYYEEYESFVQDMTAMHDALEDLDENAPIELKIKAHGDAKTYQRKAIEHIKKCLTLAPTEEEKERLILELDTIQRHRAA